MVAILLVLWTVMVSQVSSLALLSLKAGLMTTVEWMQ